MRECALHRTLLDHRVGAKQDAQPHLETERPCCLHVDEEFTPGRLLDREVPRLSAFEDLIDAERGTRGEAQNIRAVRQDSARLHVEGKVNIVGSRAFCARLQSANQSRHIRRNPLPRIG
jgi:hypothetical protein